ncbi:MAG TPA: hypothetical protein PLI45_00220 [Candidatus Woesebacteria bacterium]|nr:hypothetical protein [Candidatus Woesebacteria bacterium]
MSWLSLLIALIMTGKNGASLIGNAWWYQYLMNLVSVEQFFLGAGLGIFAIALVVCIAIGLRSGFRKSFSGIGCISTMILVWLGTLPLFEWITLLLAKGMLNAFDPVLGIVNQGAFILNAAIFVLLGAG